MADADAVTLQGGFGGCRQDGDAQSLFCQGDAVDEWRKFTEDVRFYPGLMKEPPDLPGPLDRYDEVLIFQG